MKTKHLPRIFRGTNTITIFTLNACHEAWGGKDDPKKSAADYGTKCKKLGFKNTKFTVCGHNLKAVVSAISYDFIGLQETSKKFSQFVADAKYNHITYRYVSLLYKEEWSPEKTVYGNVDETGRHFIGSVFIRSHSQQKVVVVTCHGPHKTWSKKTVLDKFNHVHNIVDAVFLLGDFNDSLKEEIQWNSFTLKPCTAELAEKNTCCDSGAVTKGKLPTYDHAYDDIYSSLPCIEAATWGFDQPVKLSLLIHPFSSSKKFYYPNNMSDHAPVAAKFTYPAPPPPAPLPAPPPAPLPAPRLAPPQILGNNNRNIVKLGRSHAPPPQPRRRPWWLFWKTK